MRPGPRLPFAGLHLARTAHLVTQGFERAMADAGFSAAAWKVLVLVRSRQWGTQTELAEAMGITGATLTHHLNALERQGLIHRWRESSNRRVQQVTLTDDGSALFDRLLEVAVAHDQRLRSQLTDEETAQLASLLDKLRAGLDEQAPTAPPSALAAPSRA